MYKYKFAGNNLVIIVYILNIEMSLVTFISARDSGMKRLSINKTTLPLRMNIRIIQIYEYARKNAFEIKSG